MNEAKKTKELVDIIIETYFQGLGNMVSWAGSSANKVLKTGTDEKYIELVDYTIDKLMTHFTSINYEKLKKHPNLIAISYVGERVIDLCDYLISFSDIPNKNDAEMLKTLSNNILNVGNRYRRRIVQPTFEKLHKFPKYKNFTFTIINHRGNEFKNLKTL